MPKINVYLPDELAKAVRDAQVPVSAVCQAALERAVRDVTAARGADDLGTAGPDPSVGLFGRFTPRARHALELAQERARDGDYDHVGPEQVLLGIIDESGNLALRVLDDLDVDPDDLRAELVASMDQGTGAPLGHVPFSPLAKRALEATTKEAMLLGHNYVGCEHMLLGLLATEDGLASKVLRRMGVELRTTRRAVAASLAMLLAEQAKAAAKPSGPSPSPSLPGPSPSSPSPESDDPATLQRILERLEAIEQRLTEPPESSPEQASE